MAHNVMLTGKSFVRAGAHAAPVGPYFSPAVAPAARP
jgi:hypothetical protein